MQPVAERGGGVGVAGFVDHLAGALIGHQHGVDDCVDERVGGERGECGDGVGGPVERGDADGDPFGLLVGGGCLDRRIPSGGDDFGVGVGGEVEPDPAAVLERAEVDFEFDAAAAGLSTGISSPPIPMRTVELGAVQVDPAGADHLHAHTTDSRIDHRRQGGEGA